MTTRLAALEARVAELESREAGEVHLQLDGPTIVEQLLKMSVSPATARRLHAEQPDFKFRHRECDLCDQPATDVVHGSDSNQQVAGDVHAVPLVPEHPAPVGVDLAHVVIAHDADPTAATDPTP